ncbi:MAG: alpha/beta hydrolase [Phycisphaerales bacterium]|nr:alpha/beta hydrolase [Phycisphaerales bacterium]
MMFAIICWLCAQSSGGQTEAPAVDAKDTLVRFVVVTPPIEEPPPRIYLALSVDGWKSNGRSLERVSPDLYAGQWKLRGTVLEYKFTRVGEWSSVELNADGVDIPNRRVAIPTDADELTILHSVERWADAPRTAIRTTVFNNPMQPTIPSTRTGDIRLHAEVYSPQLDNTRDVLVYLPPGYDAEKNSRYPVLYMHDGGNLFDARTSFLGIEWNVDETAERLINAREIEPVIIVAIYNTPDRMDEYAPVRDARYGGGGDGDKYVEFVVETVKPLIDKTYRTKPGRDDTAIAGSSMGGLISLYACFRRPDVFSRCAALSPSLQWQDGWLVDYVRTNKSAFKPRLWFDMGTREGRSNGRAGAGPEIENCRRLRQTLIGMGYQQQRDFEYVEVEGGEHNEAAWSARFDDVLRYLFPVSKD